MTLDLLTKAEAAKILTVSEATIDMLISTGVLPAYRISRSCTRLRRSEVLAYRKARGAKAAALRARKEPKPC